MHVVLEVSSLPLWYPNPVLCCRLQTTPVLPNVPCFPATGTEGLERQEEH